MHWAIKYIGQPYEAGANGPHSYDCWGLARSIFAEKLGLDMPHVAVRETTNSGAMREIAGVFGWGAVQGPPQEFDALIMRSVFGRHIAVALNANGRLQFIHADTLAGVEIIPTMAAFGQRGYRNIEVWRYDSRRRN